MPPTAIFCANDLMAVGCYEALRELGLRIPDDVAVMGYDDREIAEHLHPPLTTVLLPHFEMGTIAAELLIDAAAGVAKPPAANQGRMSDRDAQVGVTPRHSREGGNAMTERLAALAERRVEGSRRRLRRDAGRRARWADRGDRRGEADRRLRSRPRGLQMRGFAMRLFHMGRDVAVWGDMTTPHVGPGDLLFVRRALAISRPPKTLAGIAAQSRRAHRAGDGATQRRTRRAMSTS